MTDKELLAAMQADDSDEELKKELQRKLSEEMDKTIQEQNFEYIDDLTKTLDIITGEDRITSERTARGIQMLFDKIEMGRRKKRIKVAQRFAVCACAVLVVSNIWSYSAHGISVFSAAYQMINGGITIDFDKDNSEPAAGNPYEEEMRESCLEHDFGGDVLIPTYLPEGFTPTENYGHFDADSSSKTIFFHFKRGKAKLNLGIIQYLSEEDVIPYSIPSSEYNISPQVIGNTTVHISKETKDQQYWALFRIGLTQYVLYAEKLDYDECQRVLESMFENNQ